MKPKEILARAEEFLQCAEYAAQNSLFNACAICSYAALFWAARAALAQEGFDRPTWEHGELRAKFTEELITKKGRYPTSFGSRLINAFGLRNAAQYHHVPPKLKRVRRMVNHVKQFIHKVTEVIEK